MDIYYHRGRHLEGFGDPVDGIAPNRAATLLTLDPRVGIPEVAILGKAYVVLNHGSYPVSRGQVWGIQEIANDASEVYRASMSAMKNKISPSTQPPHTYRGVRDIVRWSKQYREGKWGPSFAYKPRQPKDDWEKHLDWDGGMDGNWSGLSDSIGGSGMYNSQEYSFAPQMMNSSSLSSSASSSSLLFNLNNGMSIVDGTPVCQYCHHGECTCRRCHMDEPQPCEYCESRSKDSIFNKYHHQHIHNHKNPLQDAIIEEPHEVIDAADIEEILAAAKDRDQGNISNSKQLGFFGRYFACTS